MPEGGTDHANVTADHPAADPPSNPTADNPISDPPADRRPELLRDDCELQLPKRLGASLVQSSGSASEQPPAGCVGLHCNTELV